MQNTANRKGYLCFSIVVTTAAQRWVDIVNAAAFSAGEIPLTNSGAWREVQFQVDPETSDGLSVRIGDGKLGAAISGAVQKGVTLVGAGSADTFRCSGANAIYGLMMYVQAVSGAPVLNIQLFEE